MHHLKTKMLFAAAVMALGCPLANAEDDLASMVSPWSHPTQFEDPRQTTEVRTIFVNNAFSDSFVTEGGSAQAYQVHARAKLTDDLSFIVTKFGLISINPDSSSGLDDETGMSNVDLGFKYTALECASDIITVGLRYALPIGDDDVLEGEGSGNVNPFLSFGGQKDNINYILYSGLRQRVDSEDSSFWDLSGHVSYKMDNFYPFVELNYVHVYEDGTRLDLADEGNDLINVGSVHAGGTHTLSMAVGARYRMDEIDFGVGYEFPLDRGRGDGFTDWRVGADAIYHFDI
ncbi:MAG: hypothetical protein IT292_05270 [Deltaproteobacteria bacterium]|nr:hypothetical protein [Deltaproteobacteria bacterium]